MNQRISTGMPGTLGAPFLKVSTRPILANQTNSPVKASPENNGIRKSFSTASRTPRSCVEPPVAIFSPTSDTPRKMKRNASVTINDGSPVLSTMEPFTAPTRAAKINVIGIAKTKGSPKVTTQEPKIRPAKAIIDPIERSNSPPIISIAAPIAKMPSWAAGVIKFIIPESVNMALSAVIKKKIVTRTTPAIAPSSGRFISRAPKDSFLSRSSVSIWTVSAMPVPSHYLGFLIYFGRDAECTAA